MARLIHIPGAQDFNSIVDPAVEFKTDLALGLKSSRKKIPSKYFYDDVGSDLFNQITRHPDYYLTNCELEIINTYKHSISNLLNNESINLIELGPGEGIKTNLLIDQFLHDHLSFIYFPVDISESYLKQLSKQLQDKNQHLKIVAIHSDYFEGLQWLSVSSERRNVVLFLGSSIGNFNHALTTDFLKKLWNILHNGDYVLIGFDLSKQIHLMLKAYNDHTGITREFNLNLLKRINRELGGNFNVNKFYHYATYNVYLAAMESYLVSLEEQNIYVESLNQSFTFHQNEPIHVEYSFKYNLPQLERYAKATGYEVVETFMDTQKYFVDALWRVKK